MRAPQESPNPADKKLLYVTFTEDGHPHGWTQRKEGYGGFSFWRGWKRTYPTATFSLSFGRLEALPNESSYPNGGRFWAASFQQLACSSSAANAVADGLRKSNFEVT